ncbi:S-adenosyl methyltransferase [Nonomuraea fuscirosea]|uniref:S-adenosyl methyltransferase n=1 Tax=Nonomuraea fuscirosea TaxID=1291556 RepID=A0A2T0LLZ1_9ACTN|nr:SAM-dependent methyltransferase [Nonomuraea fuscirosea]PRX44052.1 S-adenosyl methyltransferase [Nonomuraea fuscirosea]
MKDLSIFATSAAQSGSKAGFNPDPPAPAVPRRLDFTKAGVARVYDYLRNGQDNFAVDRAAATALLKQAPDLKKSVRDNREFLTWAVEYLTTRGVSLFLDLGCGLPADQNIYEIAARLTPRARVAYVDNDPMVAIHGRALLDIGEATTMIEADIRDPGKILGDPYVASMLRRNEPMAVLAADVFPFVEEADDPAAILAQLAAALPEGSVMVHSHLSSDGLDRRQIMAIEEVYAGTSARVTLRSSEQIRGLLNDRWEIIAPGVTEVSRWIEDPPPPGERSRSVKYVGGIVRLRPL